MLSLYTTTNGLRNDLGRYIVHTIKGSTRLDLTMSAPQEERSNTGEDRSYNNAYRNASLATSAKSMTCIAVCPFIYTELVGFTLQLAGNISGVTGIALCRNSLWVV